MDEGFSGVVRISNVSDFIAPSQVPSSTSFRLASRKRIRFDVLGNSLMFPLRRKNASRLHHGWGGVTTLWLALNEGNY